MTRQEALAAAPMSRRGYWCTLAASAAFLLGVALATAFVKKHIGVFVLVGTICSCIVNALLITQSAQRLFYPMRAVARAKAIKVKLENSSIDWLEWFQRLKWLAYGAWIITCLWAFSQKSEAHLIGGINLLNWSFFGIGNVVSDLICIRAEPEPNTWPQPRSVAELKPISSEHWGKA